MSLLSNSTTPLPDWVEDIYPYQVDAVSEIAERYAEGNEVVFLDAPTGSGKTLIAELARRQVNVNGGNSLYVCSDKSLQDQFARDFPYAKVLKGRANYVTQSGDPVATAADCVAKAWDDPCWFCQDGKPGCPYEIAKKAALRAELAVTNTAYFLTEANYVKGFSGRDIVIADECDTMESMMMNFVQFEISQRNMELVKMNPPKKGARKKTLIAWLEEYADTLTPLVIRETDIKKHRNLKGSMDGALRCAKELERDIRLRKADSEDNGMWLRDYDRDDERLILKPVMVSHHGSMNLWRHAEKFLLMSATVISADEMADSLGLPFNFAVVTVPMTFPVENRPVILAPVANVVYKEMEQAVPRLAYAIARIAEDHPGDRILVHTVSYDLTRKLERELRYGNSGEDCRISNRTILSYNDSRDRDEALSKYKRTVGAILLAPSMERGIDLPGDLCRVQVIAKVPFPSLANRQISARTHLPGGQLWYTIQTIRDVVQMAGRGVRSRDDWCYTYILDAQFARNLWSKWKRYFPVWFAEAVDTGKDVRKYVRR